jgi:hypothetical protein
MTDESDFERITRNLPNHTGEEWSPEKVSQFPPLQPRQAGHDARCDRRPHAIDRYDGCAGLCAAEQAAAGSGGDPFHASEGRPLNSPVMQALVGAKVSEMIEPPRSWGHAEKLAFLSLPPHLQRFYVKRESERDREVRRCQNELAVVRKKLAATEDRLE